MPEQRWISVTPVGATQCYGGSRFERDWQVTSNTRCGLVARN